MGQNTDRIENSSSIERIKINNSQLQKNQEHTFDCHQCENQFMHKKTLKRHIQSVHEGIKYACNQCEFHATQQIGLTKHIAAKHEGVKYPCNQCTYQATQKCHLTRHIQSIH